jgi:hypothetical protein
MEYKRLNRFKGIDVSEESTDASEQSLRIAENVVLRPRGSVSRMPPFRKLWNLNALGTYATQLGIDPAVDKTCLLSISQPQGTNNTPAVFLVAHDFKNNKAMGLFCAVDLAASNQDISLESLYHFLPQNASPPSITTTIQVLKKGLAENKRWFFYRFYDAIVMGNGVDENLIYQHARTSMRLRTMGSDAQPEAPIVSSASVTITPTIQAEANLVFTGKRYNPPPRPLSETGIAGTPAAPWLKVKWTPADTASEYEVDISATSAFTAPTTISTSATSHTFEGLSFSTLYYYRVRAKYDANISGNSDAGVNRTMSATQTNGNNLGEPTQTPINGTTDIFTTLKATAGVSFLGETGNHLRIAFVSAGATLSSSRSGEGTAASPLIYTVYGVGSTTSDKIIEYIDRDEVIQGILTVQLQSLSPGGAPAIGDLAATALTGGLGTGTRTEDPLEGTGEIATSFFDPGVNGLGFSSGLSIPTRIRTSDIKTIIPGSNTAGEFARYSKFRVWYRQPTPNQTNGLPANTWLLLGECNNAPGATFRASLPRQLTNDSIFFDGTDINRLPPCTMFELCEGKIFASGNPANPTRIWYSQPVHKTELLPEGFNLSKKYIDMPARKEEGSNAKVTHLKAMEQRLQVHTSRGITLIHGSTFVRAFSRSDFGAMNPAAATSWSHHISPYLGADGVLYEMSNQQALKSNIASAASWEFIRSFADIAELERNPWRANVAGDLTNQLVWVWLPCKIDGTTRLAGFLFDYETKGFSGPITWPGLISTTKLSAIDPRIVGQTEDGNLVVIDSKDINRDEFQPAETFEGNFLSVSPNKLFFQTQFMDFGVPHEQKAYLEFLFNTVRGSYAENIVITLETDEGRTKTFNYGQLRGERNKCAFMLSGYAVRLAMEVTLSANRPFVLRDAVLGYDRQKTR